MISKSSGNDIAQKQPPFIVLALAGFAMAVLDYVFWFNGFYGVGTKTVVEIMTSPGMQSLFTDTGWMLRGYAILSFVLLAYNTIYAKGHRHFKSQQKRAVSVMCYGAGLAAVGYFFVAIQEYPFLMAHVKATHPLLFVASTTAAVLFARELSTTTNVAKVDVTKLGCDKRPDLHPERFCFPVKGGYINMLDPFQGTLVNGGAGAGKSASIAAPMIYQMVQNGWTGLVYDFKYFDLTNIVYSAYRRHPSAMEDVALKIVNFSDPTRSCRINPLSPKYLTDVQFIEEYTSTCLKAINPDWQKPQGDPFWINEPIALMKALVLYFSRYLPTLCDIPHIFSFVAHSTPEEVAKLVSQDPDCRNFADSFVSTLDKKAEGQTAGIWSNIKSVARQASIDPLIMWTLSADEVDFNLNHPDHPTLLCIVSDQQKQKVVSPFISLVGTVCRTTMNVQHRRKSIFLLDEAPTLYLPEFDQLPNTGRANKIAVVWMGQNLSQLRDRYGKDKSDNALGSLSNVFFGNATEQGTLKYASEFFGREERLMQSTSSSNSMSENGRNVNDSVSFNVQEKSILKPQEISQFSKGEFAGKIINRLPSAFYRAKFKRWSDVHHLKEDEYPAPAFASGVDIERNKKRIMENVLALKQTLI
ncbi:MAG: type IV secretory system conjugative DNA transfer family protein [Prevotellaceae bacterium]|jgi:hypothetical protein|nr:type IV secretory system conjugative DNA transfer family protein [Prevotellaceae bacterium]